MTLAVIVLVAQSRALTVPSSQTRRILESLTPGDAAGGAGAAGSYKGLEALDKAWASMRNEKRPVPEFVRTVDQVEGRLFDCVILGGTLGIFYACALQRRGLSCAVVERGKVQGREQEWNLSLDEVQALVPSVFDAEDVDGAVELPKFKQVSKGEQGTLVASHFGAVRAGFNAEEYLDERLQEIWMPQVLNIGVRPNVAVERAKKNFLASGGVLFEETPCLGIDISKDGCGVRLKDDRIRGKLVIDAMGNGSPMARQARALLNDGEEPKPSGVCCVVGTLATGYNEDNSFGDLIYTNEDSREDRQYFWEAFPAPSVDPSARTTYLFTYLDIATEHTVEGQFNDYWAMLPEYQKRNHRTFSANGTVDDALESGDLKILRALYGLFPTYRDSPLPSVWDRVLAVGDASGVQSPLSFGGFGALTRHINRVASSVTDALESDALDKKSLSLINPYYPNLSATWMFQKAFVVPTNRPANFVNRLMRLNYVNMQDLGDDVMRPFNQDVTQPIGLAKVLALATLRDPLNIPQLLFYIGPFELADWLRHFAAMFAYDIAHRLLGPGLISLADGDLGDNQPKLAFRLRRLADAWEYGSGNDYAH